MWQSKLEIRRRPMVRFFFLFGLKMSLKFKMFPFSEIGIGVTGFGMLFLFLGMLLFFDRGLLAIGNVSQSSWVFYTMPEQFFLVLNYTFITTITKVDKKKPQSHSAILTSTLCMIHTYFINFRDPWILSCLVHCYYL